MRTNHLSAVRALLGILAISAASFVARAPGEVIAISGSDGTTSPSWVDIKNDTYEQRAHFSAGADRLSAWLDRQIALLKTRRLSMTTDTKDWDISMKEVEESRSSLTSRMTDLSKATTPEAWIAARDWVGEAWKRSQLAVDKMNTTVTN